MIAPRTAEGLQASIFESSAALREVDARLAGGGVVTVGRAGEGSGSFLLAYLATAARRRLLVLTASPDEADRVRRSSSAFLDGEFEEFPPWESLFEKDSEPDPEIFGQRTRAVEALLGEGPVAVVAPVQAVLQPTGRSLRKPDRRLILRVDDSFAPRQLAQALVDAGYRRFPQVARPGDFSIRGGIFDIYPRESRQAYRLEFFGDEIESIRSVNLQTQRSGQEISLLALELLAKSDYFIRGFTGEERVLFDEIPDDTIVAVLNPREVEERARGLVSQWASRGVDRIVSEFWGRAALRTRLELEPLAPEPGRKPVTLPVRGVERFTGSLDSVTEALRQEVEGGARIEVCFRQLAEVERFQEILEEAAVGPGCRARVGDLGTGFRWDEKDGGIFLSGSAILGRTRALSRAARRTKSVARAVDSFLELEEGELVVHVSHGVGLYRGIRRVQKGQRQGDHLVIEYRDGVQLLVPVVRIDLVQKYVGVRRGVRSLDKLGGSAWAKRRQRVETQVVDLATDLLEVQALRQEKPGFACAADTEWQREFEAAFPYTETEDQLEAMDVIRGDLESPRPMDRLVCGDVGYGKTELAMRAAFKVVQSGRQVAVLVPTTVLAQQHLVTFHDRMAEFPVRIEALSRLRSRKEQNEMLRRAQEGELDILIGTHRLLSGDVSFKNLGLIVIDEEQRFGVVHKERLKQLRRLVDVLTLTATPIPRTLHMALLGVKDISSLAEAPQGRQAIRTEVCAYDESRFRQILLRELNRDGQVFFLHNRVKSIVARRHTLEELVPEASIIEVHGQMDEHELERRMLGFLRKDYDVLVTTTIIESGLDIPSANTLIVERADRFGLAELHQLRGRVGRGEHQAYAYLLVPQDRPMTKDARARLEAIEEYSQLGAGFQIAMRDLEIRGAGNILGREQSGHIDLVGYDLYCRLLERAVADLQGRAWQEPPDVEVTVPHRGRVSEEYVGEATQRLRIYRAVATALDEDAVVEIEESLVDRFGEPPEETKQLLRLQMLRIRLGRIGAKRAEIEDGWVLLRGDRNSIRSSLQRAGWQVVELPDGSLGGRPSRQQTIDDFASLLAASESLVGAGSTAAG